MKPAEALQGKADRGGRNMRKALAAILAVCSAVLILLIRSRHKKKRK